jgi:hypothetical protein
MRRKYLVLGASVVVVGIAAFAWHRARGVVPDDPDEVTLFSIDGMSQRNPVDRDKPTDKELLYEFPVLGRVSITDPELRRRVVTAVKRDLDDDSDSTGHLCFQPRHVLRVVKSGRTIDLVICFQCNRYRAYVDGKQTRAEDLPVGKSSQELLNKILTDAGVPLAP